MSPPALQYETENVKIEGILSRENLRQQTVRCESHYKILNMNMQQRFILITIKSI